MSEQEVHQLYKNHTPSLFQSKLYHFAIFLFIIVCFNACQPDASKNIPDVSNIAVEVSIKRFEQDLFNIDTTKTAIEIERLREQYPAFAPIFFDQILGATDPRIAPQGQGAYVNGFINYPSVRQLYDTTQIVYPNLNGIEAEFKQAFQFLKYHFSDLSTPTITTFVSEYSIAGFIYGNNDLATGLDFYLGADYPYQQYNPTNPNFSQYLTRTFNKEHLVKKTLTPLIDDESLLGYPNGNRLIDLMIHNGKRHYIMSQILPYAPDSIIMEYSQQQIDWVENNELEMWSHFAKEDLFFETDNSKIRKLVQPSPHSPGMPPEAPGRTANWIGWQIVKTFMRKHPDYTLRDLINKKDAQLILDRSKYKPDR